MCIEVLGGSICGIFVLVMVVYMKFLFDFIEFVKCFELIVKL